MKINEVVPWYVTGIRLPRILEILLIRSAMSQAIKLSINERTTCRVIERIRSINNPLPLEQIAATKLRFPT